MNRTVKLNFLSDDSEEQESRLKLMKVLSPSKDKIDTLYNLLCTLGSSSSIVFCNHRDAVDRVHQLLADKKLLAERFHGGMEQPARERALYKFEEKLPSCIPEEMEIVVLPENPPRPPKSVWATIYIGKGKKEKLSRIDIAGFLYKKGNLTREDVGAIDVKEHYAFVAIRRAKVKQLLNLIQGEKIKGMKTIIEEAK